MDATLDAKLKEGIANFIREIDKVVADHWKKSDFNFSPPPTQEVQWGKTWAKIVTREHQHDGSSKVARVYGFVCLKDGQTKSLGVLKAGDIHMAASFQSPAKHARGNVMNETMTQGITPHGIQYLRNPVAF